MGDVESRTQLRDHWCAMLSTRMHLKRLTTDGLVTEEQKRALKKAKYIEWSHGFWRLSETGKVEAEMLGYL